MNDFNRKIIEEFRANEGRVGGPFEGAPTNPDWFHNLRAHPDATIEVGTDEVPVVARAAEGDERERLWSRQKERMPGFADYERKTTREIPVVILERREPTVL